VITQLNKLCGGVTALLDLYTPLVIGVLGSAHCLGMCGPLVVAYTLHGNNAGGGQPACGNFPWTRGFLRHGAFHLGRLCTYALLGACAAGLFRAAELSRWFFHAQGGMKMVGGIVLVLSGLVLLNILPLPSWATSLSLAPGSFLARWLPPLLRSPRVAAKMALGMATGLLPCCLSWAMIVTAASSQDPMTGLLTMVSFGLGTIPALLFTGFSAHILALRMRLWGPRGAALAIIFTGFVLILQGFGWLE
jgi:sulfite exporter TauE/SafE